MFTIGPYRKSRGVSCFPGFHCEKNRVTFGRRDLPRAEPLIKFQLQNGERTDRRSPF
jgi:hypothetical protein